MSLRSGHIVQPVFCIAVSRRRCRLRSALFELDEYRRVSDIQYRTSLSLVAIVFSVPFLFFCIHDFLEIRDTGKNGFDPFRQIFFTVHRRDGEFVHDRADRCGFLGALETHTAAAFVVCTRLNGKRWIRRKDIVETKGVFNVSRCLTRCNSSSVGSLFQKIKCADCYESLLIPCILFLSLNTLPSDGIITSHPFATNRFTAFLAHINAEISTTTTLQSSASSSSSISTSSGLPRSSLGSLDACGCSCGCNCRAFVFGLALASWPFAFALVCGTVDLICVALTLFSSSAIWWLR